jgi:hypothetical protein
MLYAMSGYRDGLEAATHRIGTLEEQLARQQRELSAMQARLASKPGATANSWPWFVAMFGAVLFGALLSSTLPPPGARAAAPEDTPPPGWGDDSIFADPAPHLGTHGVRAAADAESAASSDDEPPREERDACDVAERKAALLVRLAGGRATDGELGDLHLSCVLQGDVACRRLTMAEIKARRLMPR